MTRKTEVAYKRLLIECREMMGQSGVAAYQRAKKLVAVFDDPQFRNDIGADGPVDDYQAAEHLDELCEDLSMEFLELRALLERFPSEKDWAKGNLRTMWAVLATEKKPAREPSDKVRRTVTLQEYDKLAETCKHQEARIKHLEEENKRLQLERDAAHGRAANLEGRVEELERLLRRELTPA